MPPGKISDCKLSLTGSSTLHFHVATEHGCSGKSKLTEDLQDNRQARAAVRARLLAQAMCIPPELQESCHGSFDRPIVSQPVYTGATRTPSKMRCTTAPLPATHASHSNSAAFPTIDLSAHLHNIQAQGGTQDGTQPMLETRWFAALPASPAGKACASCITEEPDEDQNLQDPDASANTTSEGDPLVLMSSSGLNSFIASNAQNTGRGAGRPFSCQERPARGAVLYHATLTLDPQKDAAQARACQRTDGRMHSVSGVSPSNSARSSSIAAKGAGGTPRGVRGGVRGGSAHTPASPYAAGIVTQRRRPDSGCSVSFQGNSRPVSSSNCRQGAANRGRADQQRSSAQKRRPTSRGARDASSAVHAENVSEQQRTGVPEANITAMLLRERRDGCVKGAPTQRYLMTAPAGAKWQGEASFAPQQVGNASSEAGGLQRRGGGSPERRKRRERQQMPTAVQGRHLRMHVLEENIDRRIRSSQRQRAKCASLATQMTRLWSNLERTKKSGMQAPSDSTACFNEALPEWERCVFPTVQHKAGRTSLETCTVGF